MIYILFIGIHIIAPIVVLVGITDLIATLTLIILNKMSLTSTLAFAFSLFIVFSIIYILFLLHVFNAWDKMGEAFVGTISMWILAILYMVFRLKAYLD